MVAPVMNSDSRRTTGGGEFIPVGVSGREQAIAYKGCSSTAFCFTLANVPNGEVHMPKFKQTWDNITVSMFVACLAAIATAVVIGWWCVRRSPELPLLWLVALVAALIGWV